MPCIDCLEKCNGIVTPDKCIQYTGEGSEVLGICQGDSLFEVEEIIIDTLESLLNGTGIVIGGLNTTCTLISNILGSQATTAPVLFQTLITAACSLQSQVTLLNAQVNNGYAFNTSCLSGVTANSTRDQILQATITKTCENTTAIAAIAADYVKDSDLCTKVAACLAGGPSVNYNTRMVPYAPIPYVGSLSNFDNTGKGLTAFGFDKVYLMNGLNGTQDWRGRSPIGAIQNVPGGALDSAVDPTLPQNAGTNYVLNQKVGASSVTLTVPQIPSHTHSVLDPGHKHRITGYVGGGSNSFSSGTGNYWYLNPDTELAVTNIAVGAAGGGLSHTNLQPSIACYYIVYIP